MDAKDPKAPNDTKDAKGAKDIKDPDAYTLKEFCDRHRFSIAMLYNLPKAEWPRLMKVKDGHRVSREAGAEWRRRMEALAAEENVGA